MNFGAVLQQFAVSAEHDAARVTGLAGYVKRVTPIVPEVRDTVPTGDVLGYYGSLKDGVYWRKRYVDVTYTPKSGVRVAGLGASTSPGAPITSRINTKSEYPYLLAFVSRDGSEFLLNMSEPDTSGAETATPTAYALFESSNPCIPYVPVDRTLLAALASDNWDLGTVEEFENARTSVKIW